MPDYTVGIRLNADASGLVGATKEAAASQKELEQQFKATGAAQQYLHDQTKQMVSAADAANNVWGKSKGALRDLDDELTKFLSVTDKAYRSQMLLDRGQDLLTRGLQAGLLSQSKHDELLASLASRYTPAAAGAEKLGEKIAGAGVSAGFAAREVRALFDEAMRGNRSQMTGTAVLLTTKLTGIGGAALLAAGGVAALVAVLGYMMYQAEKLDRGLSSIDASLAATGRQGLLTRDRVKALVDQVALLPDQSRISAEQTLATFARVHSLSAPQIEDLSRLTSDFAVAMGVKTPTAAQLLAKAFEDPAKGAKQLDSELDFLSASQLTSIKNFAQQGKVLDAQKVLFDALSDRIKGLAQNAMTPLSEATDHLGNAWQRLLERTGQSDLVRGSLEGLATLIGKIAEQVDHTTPRGPLGPTASGKIGGLPPPSGAGGQGGRGDQDLIKQALAAADAVDTVGRKQRELVNQEALFTESLKHPLELTSGQFNVLSAALTKTRQELAKLGASPEFRNLEKSFVEMAAQAQAQLATSDKATEAEKKLAAIEAERSRGLLVLSGAELQKLRVDAQTASTLERQLAQRALLLKSQQDEQKAYDGDMASQAKEATALEDANKKLAEHIQQIGLTKVQVDALKISRAEDALAAAQESLAVTQLTYQSAEELRLAERRVAAAKEALDLTRQEQLKQAWADQNEKMKKDFERTTKEMERSLTDALMRGFQNGESIGANFWKSMVSMAETAVLRPIISPIVQPFAQAGSQISSGLGNWLSGLLNQSGLPSSSELDQLSMQASSFLVGGAALHSGGMAGIDGAMRYVHPAYFEEAPRYHSGAIAGDEIPAVLKRGEGVFTASQMRALGSPAVSVQVVNSGTPQNVVRTERSVDAKGMLIRLFTDDIRRGGEIAQTLEGTYGVARSGR